MLSEMDEELVGDLSTPKIARCPKYITENHIVTSKSKVKSVESFLPPAMLLFLLVCV